VIRYRIMLRLYIAPLPLSQRLRVDDDFGLFLEREMSGWNREKICISSEGNISQNPGRTPQFFRISSHLVVV